MERVMKKHHLALAFSSLLIISACSQKTSDEYVALAETKIQQNDVPSAIIDLKNAITANVQDPRARFLLGSLYAERGSSAAAEKELVRAFDLGYEPNEVLPVLASVYSLQFKHEEIINLVDESRNLAPEVSTSLLLYKAIAHFQLGEPYKAKKAVADANEISADSLYSKLGNAYLDFSNQKFDTSLEKINEILVQEPDFADAYLLRGHLTTASNDNEGAVKSFEKYKELLPRTYQARIFLASAYMKNEQFKEAEKEIDLLLQFNPDQPIVNQLKGTVRFNMKDFNGAKLYTETAIQNGLDNTPNRIIAGISSFKLKSYEQAYRHLDNVRDKLPTDHPVLKLLAMVELNLGKNIDAAITITEMEGLSENDMVLLSLASAQLMREGKADEAQKLIKKSDSMNINTSMRLAQRGAMRLSLDDLDGLTDLEQALNLDPEQASTNNALAEAYIKYGFNEKALELANNWIAQYPDIVSGYILAAFAYSELQDSINEQNMYDKALNIDPANPAANIYYADQYVEVKDIEQALPYLKVIIDTYPGYRPALRKYFLLQKDLNNVEVGLSALENAYNLSPDNLQYRMLFAQALFTEKEFHKAISLLEEFTPDETTNNQYWIVLGNAYLSSKQVNKATESVEKWVAMQPTNRLAYFRSISINEFARDFSKALETVKKAQIIFTNDTQFAVLGIYLNLVNGNVLAAQRSYDLLSDEVKKSVQGQGLLGQILLGKNQPKKALAKLQNFYEHIMSSSNSSLVAKALKELKRYPQAISFLQEHQKLNGYSITAEVQIAEIFLLQGNEEMAAVKYDSILKQEPNNVPVLNNLAYLLIKRNKYDEALELAKRAVDIEPNYSSIQDTYATALFKSGQYAEALKVFEKLHVSNKEHVEIALRYAEVMIAAKKTDSAQELLNQIENRKDISVPNKLELERLKQQI